MTKVKILLVEDESIESMDIKSTLESFGYNIIYVASSGEETIEKARELMPDLILMDIMLKGNTNGIEAAFKIKELNIPVIFLTAHSEELTFKRALETEPYGYLLKPFDHKELRYSIEMAIFKNKMENQLKESRDKFRNLFDFNPDYTILVGLDGNIMDVNYAAVDFTGLSKEELIGKNYSEIGLFRPENTKLQMEKFSRALKEQDLKPYLKPYQIQVIDKNGTPHWTETRIVILKKNEEVNSFLIISTDITERKMASDQLKSSLKEKDVLIKEIHHRVKNNMQIICSLLNLQSRQVADDEVAVNVLKESQNRIKVMAMLHEKLYQSKDLSSIKFRGYVEKLVSNLFYSYNIPISRVKPMIKIEDIELNIETGVPCGLIISELVSNSLKHAFPGGRGGEVRVVFKTHDDKYELMISDNGIGFPEDIDYKHTDSLGLQLVNNLVDQLEGEIKLDRSQGTAFKIIFEKIVYQKNLDKNLNSS